MFLYEKDIPVHLGTRAHATPIANSRMSLHKYVCFVNTRSNC